jgi:hypothetical protein
MKKNRILSLALAALLLAPAVGLAGQDGRFARLRERAEVRREMRDLARERVRERAGIRREQRRLRNEFRWRAPNAYRGLRDRYYRHAYRDAARDALRETRRALRDAYRSYRW